MPNKSKDRVIKSDTHCCYFPVNDAAIATGFYLTGAGVERIAPRQTYPLANHPEMYQFTWNAGRILPEYQLVYLVAGEGEFQSREIGRVRIASGTLMVLMPDIWHRYRPDPRTGWTAYWISFNGQLPHFWQQASILSPTSALFRGLHDQLPGRKLEDIVHQSIAAPGNPGAASLSALAFLADLLAASRSDAREPAAGAATREPVWTSDPMLRAALELIWNHSHRDLSVQVIARQMGVSTRTLERHFRKTLGKTVQQELTACRLARAELMLRNTQLPIKRIAYAAGFSSSTHLSVVFQRHLRQSPGALRLSVKAAG